MKITTLMLAFNEADIIQHQLEYCARYSDHIIVADNESSDDTVKIAIKFGAEVFTFSSGGVLNDRIMISVLNRSGKFLFGKDEWMFCHSVDEFIVPVSGDFRETLRVLTRLGFGFIDTPCYDMVNLGGEFEGNIVDHVKTGAIADYPWNDKVCGYKYGYAPAWQIGAHKFDFPPDAKVSHSDFIMCHYKYGWGLDRVINRHNKLVLSKENIEHSWAWHTKNHAWTTDYYNRLLQKAKVVF